MQYYFIQCFREAWRCSPETTLTLERWRHTYRSITRPSRIIISLSSSMCTIAISYAARSSFRRSWMDYSTATKWINQATPTRWIVRSVGGRSWWGSISHHLHSPSFSNYDCRSWWAPAITRILTSRSSRWRCCRPSTRTSRRPSRCFTS